MAEAGPSTSSQRKGVPDYLHSLSAAQLKAATHPSTGALCISAPPGSGKTRVLTSRVAWLVREEKIMPEEMVVVTFTNKAANEMKQRLFKLIGGDRTSRLVLGTFHATCARFLRKYGQLIGLQNNFSITDADDSRKVIKAILGDMKDHLDAEKLKITPETAQSTISWAKAKDVSPAAYRAAINKGSTAKTWRGDENETSSWKAVIANVYEQYQDRLQESNALDFDDLLVFGVKLLRKHPSVVDNIRHVLVDEMQDTNTTQYELMSLFASATRCVTTVGDPDQSVYGWRAAEIGNLDRMSREFKTSHCLLEENYRSTGRILEAALAVIEQDPARVAKGLFTSHPAGPPVTLKVAASPQAEASFIATEVKRLIAHSGGMLNYGDFVVLLRYNALSRDVEQALQAESIPSRMVGGSKFFDRMEVKDILAYLTLVVNPNYTPAFTRVVNVPKRGIGEKTVASFLASARDEGVSPMVLAERVADSPSKQALFGVKPGMKKGLVQLVNGVRELRDAASKGAQVHRLIEIVLDNISYKSHISKEPDFDSRMKNVEELMNFSKIIMEAAGSLQDLRELNRSDREDSFEIMPDAKASREGARRPSSTQEDKKAPLTVEFDPFEMDDDVVETKPQGLNNSKKESQPTSSILAALDAWEDEVEEVKPEASSLKRGRTSFGSSSQGQDKADAIEIADSSDESARNTPAPSKKSKMSPSKQTGKKLPRKLSARNGRLSHGQESDEESDVLPKDNVEVPANSPVRAFLEACTLSTDAQGSTSGDGETEEGPKVTISTCHAAKGLEYPVVFVTGVEDDIIPFFRCTKDHEIAEERRLLYVAMTRAQGLLYLTHCRQRMARGEYIEKSLSMFVRPIVDRQLGGSYGGPSAYNAAKKMTKVDFGTARPELDAAACAVLAKIFDRPVPPSADIEAKIKEYSHSRTAGLARQGDQAYADGYDRSYGELKGPHGYAGGGFNSFGGGFGMGGFGMGRYGNAGDAGDGALGGAMGGRSFSSGPLRGTTSNAAGFSSALKSFGASGQDSKLGVPQRSASGPTSRQLGVARGGASTGSAALDRKRTSSSGWGNYKDESAMELSDPGSRAKAVAPSPRWLEEYKSGNAIDVDGDSRPRTDLSSFQSSHKASLDSLKSFLPEGGNGTGSSNGSGASRSASSAGLVPRPPAAFGKAPKVGGTKSLGVRRAPSSSLKK